MKILVTGSSGLIGSEVCTYFAKQGHSIHGVDNNQRAVFFGPQGDTTWRLKELQNSLSEFSHHQLDIRERQSVTELKKKLNQMQLFTQLHNHHMIKRHLFLLMISMSTQSAHLTCSKPPANFARTLLSSTCPPIRSMEMDQTI